MEGFINFLFGAFVVIVLLGVIAMSIQEMQEDNGTAGYHYEYIDIDGNTGVASSCSPGANTTHYMSCRNGGTVIQVKSYTKVEE